jgi:chemotaxis protein CheD
MPHRRKRERETHLNPGEWFFGGGDLRVRTLLGSCVAATFWHPTRLIGGICHYLLPERADGVVGPDLDGKYGTEALTLMAQEVLRAGTKPPEYVVKLFGGGDMFPGLDQKSFGNVGAKNVVHGQRVLSRLGFTISVENVTGRGYRTLHFDLPTGEVWMRFRGIEAPAEERDV